MPDDDNQNNDFNIEDFFNQFLSPDNAPRQNRDEDKGNDLNPEDLLKGLEGLFGGSANRPENKPEREADKPQSFEDFLSGFNDILGDADSKRSAREPSQEEFQEVFEMLFGGLGKPKGEKEAPSDDAQREMNRLMDGIMSDLTENLKFVKLPPLSGQEFAEINRIFQEIFGNLSQTKKNPLEDVDTSNIDSEFEKLLKNSVSKTMDSEEGVQDTPVVDEAEDTEENEEAEESRTEVARNVRASLRQKSRKLIVNLDAPQGIDPDTLAIDASLESELVTLHFSRYGVKYQQSVRVRGMKDRGVVAFVPELSHYSTSEDGRRMTISLGLVFSGSFAVGEKQ